MAGISNSENKSSRFWLYFFLLFSAAFFNSFAVTVTIDADGGAQYSSLDVILSAIQNETIDPDTVLFIGNDQDTYTWSTYVDKAIGNILLKGIQTNPDLFPIINHTTQGTYNFFNFTSVQFEKIIISGAQGFNMGQSALSHSFKQCVFRNNTSTVTDPYVIGVYGSTNLVLENCLFEGNTCTDVIFVNPYNVSPVLNITNCTFDNNSSLFSSDPNSNIANYSFKNNIFSNNTITFRGNNLRGKTTYSLTSEPLTGYNTTGNVSNPDPLYMASIPAIPSDWKPQSGSPASQIGTSTGAPLYDIAGDTRGPQVDAGCFVLELAGPPTIQAGPKDTTVGEGGTATFSVVAAGVGPLSYAWFSPGDPDEKGTNATFSIIGVSSSDNSSSFYCVISNASGSVNTDTVQLDSYQ